MGREDEVGSVLGFRRDLKPWGINYVEVCYLPENEGAKEAWNTMGYQCFREQARKCVE